MARTRLLRPLATAAIALVTLAGGGDVAAIDADEAGGALFPGDLPDDLGCDAAADPVRCLVEARYTDDAGSQQLALALYDEVGDVAGVEVPYTMDGGFRGTIEIVPARPVGTHRRHLQWALAAQRAIGAFVAELEERAARPVTLRHAPLVWRFFRSVDRTTPSAVASDWEIGYNVVGSLNHSEERVRSLVFHEVFHFNDRARGSWSRREIGALVDGIVERCGTDVGCLTPYAPRSLKVRGGTYYAFQPDNGDIALEYAAELATRYFEEHRERLAGRAVADPFKCRTAENAEAWRALADEFFGGVDLVPACP